MLAAGCGWTDAFNSARIGDVAFKYDGPTQIPRGSQRAFTIRVEVDGEPLESPHLLISVSDPSVIGLSTARDSVHGRQTGEARLVVRLQDAMFTDSLPSFEKELRVTRKDDDDVAPGIP